MNKTKILIALVVFIVAFSEAQVATPFKERFSGSIEGGMTTIANNMVSRNSSEPYNDEGNNEDEPLVYVDIDNDSTTFNSSNAVFTNPELNEPCIALLRTFLYWSGADATNNGQDNQPNWDFDEVKLMIPGDTNYRTVQADEVIYRDSDQSGGVFDNKPYVCVKDISSIVATLGPDFYGSFQVANVESKIGTLGDVGVSAGWQIVFIYESPELPSNNITLFDGYASVGEEIPSADIDFSGFVTVPNGPVVGHVLFGAFEGDRGAIGDQLLIKDISGNFVDLMGSKRDTNNFFNSRITLRDSDFLNRNPASTNTLGFDVGVFELSNPNNTILNNQSTATTLRITSNSEVYGLYLLGLAVDVFQPILDPFIITQLGGSPRPNPGDIVQFNLNLQNRGNDDARNLRISTILTGQMIYIEPQPGDLPVGVTYTYDEVTNELTFNIEDGIMNEGAPGLGINLEFAIKNECYFLEENCDLELELEFEASFNGATNPDEPLTSISTADPTTCEKVPILIEVTQPTLGWETQPEALDRVLECGDSVGLAEAQNLMPFPDRCLPFQFITITKTSGDLSPDPSCVDAGTYTNTWNFTDTCGVTIAEYIQKIIVDDVLGAENNELKDFEYSINSNKIMTLSSQDVFKGFKVFNLLGQETFAKTLHSNKEQINLSGLNTGVYIILVKGQNETQKVIKIILK